MITAMRILFGKLPKPGDRFYFDQCGNPFEDSWTIEVTETRGKWIQYEYTNKKKFGNAKSSMVRSSFHFCYKPSSNK